MAMQNEHVRGQVTTIDQIVDQYQYNGLTLNAIETAFNHAKTTCAQGNAGRFEAQQEIIANYLNGITFSAAISSGAISLPVFEAPQGDIDTGVNTYLVELGLLFRGWFTCKLEDDFDPVQGEYEYGPH